MPNTKPFVAAACVCEKVLMEADGVATLVRIIDTHNIIVPPEVTGNVQILPLTLNFFLSVKSGDVRGSYEMGMVLRTPDGKSTSVGTWPVVLTGATNGAQLTLQFQIASPQFGFYQFDVLWKNEVLTSIPFEIKRVQGPAQPRGSSQKPN